ncbi:hypothetical protein CHS0354_002520 [Potamilus streckersoni]|uniref:NB-ARC domain-containing protein n=1 Tax=Potamilus streckersoni TaxID=2493646 RepID=A0AAE0SRY8_9BIVA|nr:hypothetical protein CHS0354_002520 [Potamilus streckersoni]
MDTEVYDSAPFRGRTEFLNDLQKAWMHNKCVVFGVYGMKSVGKSRTARKHITDIERLVLQNNKQFREVKIVDVNLRLYKTDREIYVQMCESLGIVADIYNERKQIQSHIKMNKDKYFIVLFDNFDALKKSTLKDELKSFVVKLAVIRYNIQLYITSTENILFTQIKALFYHKTLEPFNDNDAKELLKAAANDIDFGEYLDQIVQLCAGLPLAILMVASELQTDDGMTKPEEIVEILTDSRLEALSKDNYPVKDRIENVYKKFIMKLTPVFQQRLAKLQYIEGHFNAKQAAEMLGHKSVPAAKHHALIPLKRNNYLSYDSKTERFNINSVLRDCISVYICIHRLPDIRKRFCRIFTEEMTKISRQMYAAEYVQAVAALNLEHPNLLKLMKEVFYTKEDTYSFLIEIASNCSDLLEIYMPSHYEEFCEGCLKMVKQYGRHEDEAVVKIAYGSMLTNVKDNATEGEKYYLQALEVLKEMPLSKLLAELHNKLGQNLFIQGRIEDSVRHFQISLKMYDALQIARQPFFLHTTRCLANLNLSRLGHVSMLRSKSLSHVSSPSAIHCNSFTSYPTPKGTFRPSGLRQRLN